MNTRYSFSYNDELVNTNMNITGEYVAEEIVGQFALFLISTGFEHSSIANALILVGGEMTPSIDDYTEVTQSFEDDKYKLVSEDYNWDDWTQV